MKTLLSLFSSLVVLISLAQEKIGEKYFETSGRQRANFVINKDGLTYSFINHSVGTEYGHYNHNDCKLFISSGNTILDTLSILDLYSPNPTGTGWDPSVLNAHVDSLGNVHIFYYPALGHYCYEKGQYPTNNLKYLKYNQYGYIEWNENISNLNEKALAFNEKRIYSYYNDTVNNISGLKSYDGNGALTVIDDISLPSYHNLQLFYSGHDKLIAATTSELIEIDINNGVSSTIPLHFDLKDHVFYNGEDYLLSNDYIYLLNSSFQLQDSIALPTGYDMQFLKVLNNELHASGTNGSEIIVLKDLFNQGNQISNLIPVDSNSSFIYDFTPNQINILEEFDTWQFSQIRKQDYSLFSTGNTYQYTGGDVEIVNFQFDYLDVQYEYYLAFPAFLWTVTYTGNLRIKNTGSQTIESVQIHYNPYAYWQGCHIVYADSVYTNLNLAPGAEMDLYIDTIIDDESYVDTNGIEAYYPICFFATSVNDLIDTNTINNGFCQNISVGYSGTINSAKEPLKLSPNPVETSFTLYGTISGKIKVNIYSTNGQLVHEQTINSTDDAINVEGLRSGVYIVNIQSDELKEEQNLRFIKL